MALKLDGESGWMTTGTVHMPHATPRSYLIHTDRRTLRRNRRHLRPTFLPTLEPDTTEDTQVAEHSPPSPVRQTVPLGPVVEPPAQARVSSQGRILRPPERLKDFVINT